MKRATLHIVVQSICCAKIKGVDGLSVDKSVGTDPPEDDESSIGSDS